MHTFQTLVNNWLPRWIIIIIIMPIFPILPIFRLKLKTSCGHDGISTKLLKSIKHEASHAITIIMNQSINTGIFPDKLKFAKAIPIFKKGDKSLFENYRPISILPAVSKNFEIVIFDQLYAYFVTN